MSMSELSQDLLEEIFCRVPAISLKPLRSTCKQWRSLFSDERFRRKHFDKAPKQSMVLMLMTKNSRICSLNLNLNETPSVEVGVELSEVSISEVFHCDGLLLYTNKAETRMVVWNPFMGTTRWIQHIDRDDGYNYSYVLGSYQDNKSGNTSYKVLRYCYFFGKKPVLEICELYSNSWRILDVTPDFWFCRGNSCVSLKGKTYWFASYAKDQQYCMVSFDYTTEIFKRHMSLPYQFPIGYHPVKAISSVREEKISMLLQLKDRKEIWVTNKIDETTTQVLSWSKVLTVDNPDLDHRHPISFLFDEENRKIVCCERRYMNDDGCKYVADWVYIVGENDKVTQLGFGEEEDLFDLQRPHLFGYVPSLFQIEHPRCKE